ncbi:magnesium transporter CorA family protein [Gemmobacter nectariphilus]|uniref:magnesium transporter CorA family protein n=1 Tax=Gemmobacter nectariphilus TaxID=220343 RepID=UPI0004113D80|nr:magnesium transporter CorA family protein [Gemmobacter nectariphilus]
MLYAYRPDGPRLERLAHDAALDDALWIDLYRPMPAQVEAVVALGIEVPTLADMEEIEISNRLYRDNGIDYMTVVLPGTDVHGEQLTGPVTFILAQNRLVTVRHHNPRPFETYPARAEKVGPGCGQASDILLGLIEEIIGRQADLLEAVGKTLDAASRRVFHEDPGTDVGPLRDLLRSTGMENERIGRVRLGLLTLERALGFLEQSPEPLPKKSLGTIKALRRDIAALSVHADFLGTRVEMASDVTLGIINIGQSQTTKTVSVVAVIFMPPTLVASVYGMNFRIMPELDWAWGYPGALGLMLASAVGAYLFFRWRRWL